MTFINSYKAPDIPKSDISLKEAWEYDVNSIIPVPTVLETHRVQLVPFIPAIHAEIFHAELAKYPDLVRYIPHTWPTLESLLRFVESFIRQDEGSVLFAIIDKTKSPSSPSESAKIRNGRIAGVIGWLHGLPQNLALEIGPVIILPEFQRTFVSANAIGLVLKYALDLPSQGGLGYRRVAWTANPLNQASVTAAEKMGFEKEGVMRWTWVLAPGKQANEVDGKERGEGHGRDSVLLSLCWDDWEGGVRDVVLKRMERA